MLRYFGDYVLSSLQFQRLKLAKPSQLNDPFEFLPRIVGEIDEELRDRIFEQALFGERFDHFFEHLRVNVDPSLTRESLRELVNKDQSSVSDYSAQLKDLLTRNMINTSREKADESFRLLCFCDPTRITNYGDILMWSHYGHAHSGYRLHFDTGFLEDQNASRKDIEYSDYLAELPIEFLVDNEKQFEAEDILNNCIKTKGKFWKYEAETRFFIPNKASGVVHDMQAEADFLDFPATALKRVDCGVNANPRTLAKLGIILGAEKYAHVEVYQATRSETNFRLSYERLSIS